MKDQTRNLNPTPEARIAMLIWGREYSYQDGGSMDFWDRLPESQKRVCRDSLIEIIRAAKKHNYPELDPSAGERDKTV